MDERFERQALAAAKTVASGFYIPGVDREDLEQEAAAAICAGFSKFEGSRVQVFFSWACKVARNRLIDVSRRERRRTQSLSRFEPPYDTADPSAEREVESAGGARDEGMSGIYAAISKVKLTDRQRELIWELSSGKGLQEAAEPRACSRQAVFRMKLRIRKKVETAAAAMGVSLDHLP